MITSKPANPGRKYLVIGQQCWGTGTTLQEATANCKKNFSRSLGKFAYIAFDCDESVQVTGMGDLSFSADAANPYTELFRYGIKSEPTKK